MRRLPEEIDLGLAIVQVEVVDAARMREEGGCEEDEATPEGLWDYDHETIYIGCWLSAKTKRQTLFHELVHAALDYREQV